MLQKLLKLDSSWQLLIAIALAMFLGAFCMAVRAEDTSSIYLISQVCEHIGALFLWALKLVVVPLVFISILSGVGKLRDLSYDHLFTSRAFLYQIGVGFLATSLAILLVYWIVPMPIVPQGESPSGFFAVLELVIPSGLLEAAEDPIELLGIVLIAAFAGLGLAFLPASLRKKQGAMCDWSLSILTKGADYLVTLAPIGVFGLVFPCVLETGPTLLFPLGRFFLLIVLAFFLHIFCTLGFLAWAASKGDARKVFRRLAPAVWTALSTGCVIETAPLALKLVKKRLGVPKSIARRIVPLGVRMNTDGVALCECLVVLFFAQFYAQVDSSYLMTFGGHLALALIAQIAALSLVGNPSASLLTMTVMIWLVEFPVESIGIILVADRVMDRMRIAINAISSGIAALFVSQSMDRVPSQKPFKQAAYLQRVQRETVA